MLKHSPCQFFQLLLYWKDENEIRKSHTISCRFPLEIVPAEWNLQKWIGFILLVCTTTNVYAHVFRKADEKNAEILENLF